MAVAYCVVGMGVGALLAVMGLVAGNSLWTILLLYMFGGSLAVLGLAVLIYVLPRDLAASADETGSEVLDG